MAKISLDEVCELINGLLKEEVLRVGIRFRLPAPVASRDTSDILWSRLKSVHPWIKHPREILPTARSVIVFALPLSIEAVESNVGGKEPSIQWLREYLVGNRIIEKVGNRVAEELRKWKLKSIAIRPTYNFDEKTLTASWSHRHAGYVCGLGTFGLNNMLITPKGCAVRLGTILTEAVIEETPRPTSEYCLEKRGISCSVCVRRCPLNALSTWEGNGKFKCFSRLTEIAKKYKKVLHEYADACGKCCVGLPCSLRIP
ncbi:MAG: epoxyqueuosine reductase [Desulfurococcales archaeon]|nr:epoxyqueuosine reductase [Desulfurococcales archaeon]